MPNDPGDVAIPPHGPDPGPEEPAWARRPHPLREAFATGRHAIAMWATTPWLGVPEILGAAGADALIVDLEHVSHDVVTAERLIVAADAAGLSALVRPPGRDAGLVSRILDSGAHGIVFPHVEDAAGAAEAVACTRYPPAGVRGWGGAHTRFAGWQGGYAPDTLAAGEPPSVYGDAYVRAAGDHVVAIMLVETRRGVEQVEAIVGVDGVDAVIFGWGDFSVEAGFDATATRAAARRVYEAARAAGVGVALNAGDEFYPGCFTIAGIDSLHMSAALTAAVRAARRPG